MLPPHDLPNVHHQLRMTSLASSSRPSPLVAFSSLAATTPEQSCVASLTVSSLLSPRPPGRAVVPWLVRPVRRLGRPGSLSAFSWPLLPPPLPLPRPQRRRLLPLRGHTLHESTVSSPTCPVSSPPSPYTHTLTLYYSIVSSQTCLEHSW